MKYLLVFSLLFLSLSACKKDKQLPQDSENKLVVLTDQTFDEKIRNGTGVSMVFFHANWCHLCEAQRPHVEEAVGTSALEDVFFGEVDHVYYPDVFTDEGVPGFPTLYIYVNGEFKQEIVGGQPIEAIKIKEELEKYL